MNIGLNIFIITQLLLFIFFGKIQAQVNLVPNGGFESYTACPTGDSQLNYTENWYAPTLGTPDYFDTCFTFSQPWTGEADVPSNFTGNQIGYNNSSAYVGVYAFDFYYPGNGSTYREYIQTKLSNTLVASQKYYVSFYVSLADLSIFIVDDFGAFISQNAIYSPTYTNFTFTPQITNPQGQYLNNSAIWTKISGSFIASGNEHYITIGNFKNDIYTDTVRIHPNNFFGPNDNKAYYYIDNVCVSTDSLLCNSNFPVGLNENKMSNSKIYYRDDSKKIVIQTEDAFTLKVYDLYGIELLEVKLKGSQEVDVTNLITGYYLIYFNNSKGTLHKKILINNN